MKICRLAYQIIPSSFQHTPNIPRAELKTYLFPDIHDKVLLSVSSFCDHGYKVILKVKKL